MNPLRFRLPLAIALLAGLAPAAVAVDTVVPNNQIVQGFQCVGPTCVNNESMTGPTLMSKSTDTPGIRLFQTGGTYAARTWDIGGNESNFFVRDNTGGSLLPFRIFPGAPTNALQIGSNGEVSTGGVVQQTVTGIVPIDAVDGSATLAALRDLTISHYTTAGATHAAPSGAAFRAAFGLGGSDTTLAPQDVAAVALASVKALDSRVTAISLTPGPKGDTGAAGPAGASGGVDAAGSPDLAAANARIRALERANARMARTLAALQKQVRSLARTAGTSASSSAPTNSGRG